MARITIRAGLGWISYILGSNTANAAAAILPNMERHYPKHPEAEVRIWRYTYDG
jgi:hypothetical protein